MHTAADDEDAVPVPEGPRLPHSVLAKKLKHYDSSVGFTTEGTEFTEDLVQNYSLNSIPEKLNIEVYEQTERETRQFQVRQQLSLVQWS